MCKKTGLKGAVNFSSVDFNPIDTNDIWDMHKYLMKRTWYKIMFGLIKKILIGLSIYGGTPLYLTFRCVNWYFEEINGNKYLTPVPTNESKDKIKKKYEEQWIKIEI